MDIPARILRAAQELMATKGLVQWTVDDLAKQAGISKRTLYRYFASKDEIIEEVINIFMAGLTAQVNSLLEKNSSPVEVMTNMAGHVFTYGQNIFSKEGLEDLKDSYPHLWQKIDDFRSAKITSVIKHFSSSEQHTIIKELDEQILVTVLIAIIQSVVNPTYLTQNNISFAYAIEQLRKLLLQILE